MVVVQRTFKIPIYLYFFLSLSLSNKVFARIAIERGRGEEFVNNRSLILPRSETCVTEILFSLFLQASFLSSGFSIFFFSFREEGKEGTLSGIVSIREGEKDGRESSPRVSKVVSVLHFRREMSGRRINRGNPDM